MDKTIETIFAVIDDFAKNETGNRVTNGMCQ